MAYYTSEAHRARVGTRFIRREGKTGYTIGKWKRLHKYPLATMPVMSALVFDCPREVNRVRACATKLAARTGMVFKREKRADGYHLWRMA